MITCPEATRAAPTPRPEPVREKCSALGLVPSSGSMLRLARMTQLAGLPNSSFVRCRSQECGGVWARGKCSAGGLSPAWGGAGPASRTRHSYVATGPKNVPIVGCGQGECSAGACPPLGEGHGRPPELVIRMLRLVPRMCQLRGEGEGNVALGLVPHRGRGIGSADDPQTLPPTRRPHRRRDGFQTRPGRGWGTPTPTGYRSGSTTVRNGNR